MRGAAGLEAALNLCGFAWPPCYLGLVIARGGGVVSRLAALAVAGSASFDTSAGFHTVFGIFGLLVSPPITSAQRYLPFATVIGVVLNVLAVWLLAGKDITVTLAAQKTQLNLAANSASSPANATVTHLLGVKATAESAMGLRRRRVL